MADKKKNREMVARRGVKRKNVDNSGVDIQSFYEIYSSLGIEGQSLLFF
jgi:hypothetical protein